MRCVLASDAAPDHAPAMPNPLISPFLAWARRLRYPTLFKITALLFAVNVVVPDAIPLIDEILLGLATLLLASWKDRNAPVDPARR